MSPDSGGAQASYDPQTVQLRSFYDAVPGFIAGSDTPRLYLERCLEHMAVREPDIKAFVIFDADAARAAADAATARYRNGQALSPIDGMPFAVKDLFKTADFPTELNSPLLKGDRHALDAAHVYALRQGGAVLLGKTTLPELGSGQPSETRNPFDLARSPGGSSSGTAAAIGSSMVPLAIGNQGRGSILRPSSFCANVALKPTFGALHSGGMLWRSPSYSVLGVHAGNTTDVWRTAWQIARIVGGDPGHPGLFGEPDLRAQKPTRLIRLDTTGWAVTNEPLQEKFEAFLRDLQGQGVEIMSRRDDPDIEAFETALTTIPDFQPDLAAWEIKWPALLIRDMGRDKINERLVERFEAGETMTLEDYRQSLEALKKLRDAFAAIKGKADACITLSTPTPPPVGNSTGNSVYGDPSSCLEAPAWNIPLLESQGLPMGIQLLGHPHDDYVLGCLGRWMMERFLDRV
jgi:Asp-tRNA(Asn)/Glu-tRNA(Gln) amidotransferase A subunit family amidase